MKKVFLLSCLFAASFSRSSAFTTVIVKDSISTNTHWTCDQQYLLQGYVYVTAGATLTIDPGVIIKGDKDTKGALIIERNAKISAIGTPSQPIVFTSNQDAGERNFGDWGGVILCGNAPTNWVAGQAQVEGGPRSFYGGNDPHDNSGVMQYVRIEFGGVAFSPNNEVNSLTFCGVGDGTTIDHIQASFNGDDAFEWFGGTVNAKYLVALNTWDDDFDTDCGFQGKVQFGAVIRYNNADLSGSKAFESDSYQAGTASGIPADNTKMTRPVFSNITAIGPVVNPATSAIDPNFVAGAHIRRGSAISILNSVFAGWPCGLLIDESSSAFGSTAANILSDELQFKNNIICGTALPSGSFNKDIVFVKDGARSLTPTNAFAADTVTPFAPTYAGPRAYLSTYDLRNKMYATEQSSVFLGGPWASVPNLVPNSTSPIVYNTWKVGTTTVTYDPSKAINTDTSGGMAVFNAPAVFPDFTATKASDPFFTPVKYVGAFAGTGSTSDNWMKGWCEFDPNKADYSSACYVAPPPPEDHTGVAQVNNSLFANATVYPNPAQDVATLSLDMKQNGNLKIAVIDMTGKVVKTVFNGSSVVGNQTFDISTNDMPNGLYVIAISSDNKVKTLKLSVIK
ncbi:MAG: hypothetical protein JWQ38_1514 [Flavipsychrobacter sp.]|nr:hypothetical protein [Flavipsychrobacter sp.]